MLLVLCTHHLSLGWCRQQPMLSTNSTPAASSGAFASINRSPLSTCVGRFYLPSLLDSLLQSMTGCYRYNKAWPLILKPNQMDSMMDLVSCEAVGGGAVCFSLWSMPTYRTKSRPLFRVLLIRAPSDLSLQTHYNLWQVFSRCFLYFVHVWKTQVIF